MTPSLLTIRNVAVRRGGEVVLREVDLEIPAGSRVAIVGPSGAGKTTLLRAVAGLDPLTTGSVELLGEDLAGTPSHRRGMAAVFQQPRLFPNIDVADNIAFPLRMQGVGRRERRSRAVALLDEVGLAGFADRGVADLSGGEARRVALARALAASPRVLLLDEPLVGVDPARRAELRALLRRVHADHAITTLHVTHDREEAAELGDTVALMMEGRVWQHAPPRDLFDRPISPVVARFFGAENVLTGEVVGGWLRLPGGHLDVNGVDGTATVAIRPERLALDPDGTLRGTVTSVGYRGAHVRVEVDVGLPLVLDVPPAARVEVGEDVGIVAEPGAVWRLPDPIEVR